jgi:multisubunit Na+/H+ antiporter MnhF subunit
MHDLVYDIALGWMTVMLGVCVLEVVRAKSVMVRMLALDTLTLVLVAVLVLYATTQGATYFLDAALVLALVSFLGTIAAARYHSEGRIA